MRKLKFSCMLLMLILSIFAGVGVELTRAEVVDTNDEENPISTNVQENSFIWNNRAFVFYCNGAYMVYKSRSNFTDWSSEISIRTATDGAHFSVWLEEDGTSGYIHYAYTAKTLTDENVYYRKGQLLPDGAISWSAGEQTIIWMDPILYDGWTYNPYIATDSDGYPIIVAAYYTPPNGGSALFKTWVRRSATKDGTWNTDLTYSWWQTPGSDNPQYAWSVNTIIPIQSRKFHVISVRVDGVNKDFYYNGASWSVSDDPLAASYASGSNQFLWSGVAENGNDVIHLVYNRYFDPKFFFQHRKWNSSGWFYISPNYDGDDAYEWASSARPRLSLNSTDNTMRATWLEYNGTDFLNNTIWYRDWNGTDWTTPAVWYTETDDIIEHEDFTSIYSSDLYYAICYITNATSKNVEFLYTPPLFGPPTGEYYDVEIYIRINGYEPYTNVTFTIDSTTYANGQTASLFSDVYGDYHNLTGTSLTHLSFINWTVTGDVTVSSASDPAAHLFVSGTGTLTEHLNATVDIIHNETIVINFSADDWLFVEHKYYDFQSTYILTNSYIDTVMWSFVDYPGNNITFYFTNSTSEGVMSYSEPYALTGGNATYSYSWINLTDQTFTVTISLWPKYKIIDTLYVDLYVFGNCSGYGMTNSTDLWVTAQTDYMNLYSQGGAEELTTSGVAGRLTGGDFFNLYAYNNSYARSDIYYRNLVHAKVLFKFAWEDVPSPLGGHVARFGFDYYARGAWVDEGFSVEIPLTGYSDTASDKYAIFNVAMWSRGDDIVWSDMYAFFDVSSTNTTADIWVDLWFNKANASSIFGVRTTSYYFAMSNEDDWFWKLVHGGTWGASYTDTATQVFYGELLDNSKDKLFASEIELVKLWAKVTRGTHATHNSSVQIQKIRVFDLTFKSEMTGIMTPAFEDSKTASVAQGGVLGVIASILQGVFAALAPAFSYAWTGLVWLLDEAIFWITGQEGAFSGFTTLVGAVFSSVLTFMIDLAGAFVDFTTTIGYTVSWFFTDLFSSIWGILNFLLLTPSFNVFGAFATIVGVSLAWLGGTTYTNAWGQVYDFSYLSSMTIAGTGFSGGIVVFYLIFVCGFFIQILACVGTMSIEPIAQPIRLFWGIIMFMITVIEILWNITTGFISLLVQIVQALRDIAPRPLGL